MKHYFIASLVKNGLLGGGITVDSEAITYHTGKLTIPQEYRHLVMKYSEISDVTKGWLLFLPTVTVTMRDGNKHRFAVFFDRNRLVDILAQKGAQA